MKFLISKYLALILLQKKNIIPFRNFTPTSDILQKKKIHEHEMKFGII